MHDGLAFEELHKVEGLLALSDTDLWQRERKRERGRDREREREREREKEREKE